MRSREREIGRDKHYDSRRKGFHGRFGGDYSQFVPQHFERRPRVLERLIFSVFVTNFSEEITWEDLRRVARQFGVVDDVFIPKKRDIHNKIFAFIQFKGNIDLQKLIQDFNGTELRGRKLTVQQAKSGRNSNASSKIKGEQRNDAEQAIQEGRMNFRDALLNSDTSVKINNPNPAKHIYIVADPVTLPGILQQHTFLGEVSELEVLDNLHNLLVEDGISFAKVTYLGGMEVLISFNSDKEATAFTKNGSLWDSFFKHIKVWDGTQTGGMKIASLCISGLPIKLREAGIFNKIGALFGRVVGPSDFSWNDPSVAQSLVQVLVDQERSIDELVTIFWRGQQYTARVAEARRSWVPSFVNYKRQNDFKSEGEDMENFSEDDLVEEEDWLLSEEEGILNVESSLYSPPEKSDAMSNDNKKMFNPSQTETARDVTEVDGIQPDTEVEYQSETQPTGPDLQHQTKELSTNREKISNPSVTEGDLVDSLAAVSSENFTGLGRVSSLEEGSPVRVVGVGRNDICENMDEGVKSTRVLNELNVGSTLDADRKSNEISGGFSGGSTYNILENQGGHEVINSKIQQLHSSDPSSSSMGLANQRGSFAQDQGVRPKRTPRGKKEEILCRRSERLRKKVVVPPDQSESINETTDDVILHENKEVANSTEEGILLGFQVDNFKTHLHSLISNEQVKCQSL